MRERIAAAIYRVAYATTADGLPWATLLELAELPTGGGGGPFRHIRDRMLEAADAAIAELDTMLRELAPDELAKVDAALEELERAGIVTLAPRLVR